MYKTINSLLPTLKLKLKPKIEGLIAYSTDQQLFKFKVKRQLQEQYLSPR